MIYILRTLWLLFYIPVVLIGILSLVIQVPSYLIACAVLYIKTGSGIIIPDVFTPFNIIYPLYEWYDNVRYKIEKLDFKLH